MSRPKTFNFQLMCSKVLNYDNLFVCKYLIIISYFNLLYITHLLWLFFNLKTFFLCDCITKLYSSSWKVLKDLMVQNLAESKNICAKYLPIWSNKETFWEKLPSLSFPPLLCQQSIQDTDLWRGLAIRHWPKSEFEFGASPIPKRPLLEGTSTFLIIFLKCRNDNE